MDKNPQKSPKSINENIIITCDDNMHIKNDTYNSILSHDYKNPQKSIRDSIIIETDDNMQSNIESVKLDLTRIEKNPQKSIKKYKFCCEICNYMTSIKCNYTKHFSTRKHNFHKNSNNNEELISNTRKKYSCVSCEYYTNNQKDYNKHLLTQKHIHIIEKDVVNTDSSDNIIIDKNIFIEIIKNNTEFKDLIMEQNKTIMEQNSKITEQNTKLNKMLENGIVNTITNNTNCNNKTFNLQFFLNEQCKDAINMIDFINSLQFNAGSVEYTGKHGYVEGMTKLIMDGLKELDIYKRPIHCTDLKREVLYIKEENKWEKDTDEKIIFNKALNKVIQKNIQQIRKWREENPRCEIMETKEYEFHFILMQQCIGGGTGQQEPNNKKIIKNIAKYVLLDRNV